MEKEYQYIPCPCGKTLRISISEKDCGKTIEATCPECGRKPQAVIVDLGALIQRLDIALKRAIGGSEEVLGAVRDLLQAGFEIDPMLLMKIVPISWPPGPEPKVEGGEIKPGTFSDEDTKWAREIKIDLSKN